MHSKITPISVLGMHRSGTSCLTGLLQDAGVFLGEVQKQNPYNLKGNHENLRIMHLQDEVLATNNGSWDNPPLGTVTWSAAQKASLQTILGEYKDHPLWAFKDPRTLFTLSAWQEAIPGLRYIGTFRHPGAVAQSLYRRGRLPADKGYALWLRCNQRLLELHTKFRFDILCFDLKPAAYVQAVGNAFRRLGLDVSNSGLAFFEENLRSTDIEPMFADPPKEIMETYDHLRGIAA